MDPAECVNAFTMLVGIESVGDYFFGNQRSIIHMSKALYRKCTH